MLKYYRQKYYLLYMQILTSDILAQLTTNAIQTVAFLRLF